MAAPPEVTVNNLSGKWTMNKSLSEDQNKLLSLQGIGWVTRKAIQVSTITLEVKQYAADDGVVHVDITSHAGSLSSTQENRTLDWAERTHKDQVFGNVKGQSRLFKTSEFQSAIEGLTEDNKKWLLAQVLRNGSPTSFLEDEHVQSVAFSQDSDWVADQIWGFETIDGVRRYTRRVLCKKGDKVETLRLVYDYNGPLDA